MCFICFKEWSIRQQNTSILKKTDHVKLKEFKYLFASLKTPTGPLRYTSPAWLCSLICFHQYKIILLSSLRTKTSGLQQYRIWSPSFVFDIGNYYTARQANFSWNCLLFCRLYFTLEFKLCSMHYCFLHYSSEFLTALFESAYELSHPPKSTLMVCQSTNQLSSKCLICLWQNSLFI